jgi:hypothetical protein
MHRQRREHPKIVILIGQDADQIKPASGPQAPFMVFGGEPKAALNVRKISKVMADQIHVTRICVTICSRDQFCMTEQSHVTEASQFRPPNSPAPRLVGESRPNGLFPGSIPV